MALTLTKSFRATHRKIKGEFAGPWKVLTWDFVNRVVYVLPETDDHLEGGGQVEWSYDDIFLEERAVFRDHEIFKLRFVRQC